MAVTLILEPGEGELSALVTTAYAHVYACCHNIDRVQTVKNK